VTAQNDPNSLSDRLLDALLAEGNPGGASTPTADALAGADPAAARERDRLVAFLKVAAGAHDVVLGGPGAERAAAERVVARVRRRVHDEEDRLDRVHPAPRWWRPGPLWARVFAASVAVHAAAIVVLAITVRSPGAVEAERTDDGTPIVLPRGDETLAADSVYEEPLPAPVSPYAGGLADLPIGTVLATLPDGDSWKGLEPSDPDALRRYVPSVARSMWLRSDAGSGARAEIYLRLGVPAVAMRPKPTLEALAAQQAKDGSFEPMPGHGRVQSTATVLLAFESAGHASRAGAHRAVVESGVRYLRHALALDGTGKAPDAPADAIGESWALLALTEDVMLSSGSLTPAETRARSAEIRRLADAIASRPDGARGIAALATASAARLRTATPAASARGWGDAYLASASAGPDALYGTAMLVSGRTADFTAWVATALPRIDAKFALDGLVRSSVSSARVEETALALLALQVPIRTY
jgi:hypothetical protein